jgi:hypothetical protein
MADQTKAAPAELPEPTANFALNKGWGTWEEVIDSAAGDPDVVAMYTADQMRTVIAPLIAERDTLAAKLAEAVDALRPFAADAAEWKATEAGYRPPFGQTGTNCNLAKFTVGDLRRAAAIVKEHTKAPPEVLP